VVNNLSNQVVYSLWEDPKGNMWAGTMGGGLDLFDRQTRRFVSFNEKNGLGNNIIKSIIGDDKGYLWLSTNKGISRFNPLTKAFKNYEIYNGLQSQEFIVGSGFKTREGRILFGGVNGFNVINPPEVRENKNPPLCRFTGFYLFNKPAGPGNPNSPLKKDLNAVNEITLTHDQSDFTFTYSALNYTVPSNNRYSYLLEGFDKSWTDAGHDTKATYTNLPPGDYRFLVKAANNDGLWNDHPTTLIIHIIPPFWKTWWAYLIYLMLLMSILYIIYRDISNKERLKAQIRMERLTADKMKELNRIKLNFFTHVSHELRTPLSLIMDPLRKMIREEMTAEQTKKYGGLMYKNAQRLMQLIDQMLDLRKIEEGHLNLHARPENIVLLTKNIAGLFNMHAIERNIHYSISTTADDLEVWIDQDKFEKIIFNLISNAFKYTADNGSIMIRITTEKTEPGFAVIHVKDTGVGIPSHLKNKVFELFYQVEDSSRYENGSTGIGLTLTRELVELHKGRIEVESEPGKGSDFIIYLPFGIAAADSNEQPGLSLSSHAVAKPADNIYPAPLDASARGQAGDSLRPPESGPLLLLVEDNKDLREYLNEELSRHFSIEDAADGQAGHEKALQLVPDLIISDIMMPEMNGIELCRKIKTDERTSHIPVILLTAKQAETHQIEGYSAGADAYVPKPFNLEVLLARIKNLLDSRKKLRELYGKETDPSVSDTGSEPQMNPIDREFLDKTIRLVEENLSDIRFDIDRLSDMVKVSRRQLYRKIKALTNQTVHDFVTDIRLKRAAALLLAREFTVSEVAYKVGFSEPANFSRSFARRYGKSPKRFVAEYERKNR
jgi:signal transduction histidine kinase/DNA-binding response OmpR family regulator